jgi:MFS family permease
VDRFHRARILVLCMAAQAAIALLLALSSTRGWASRELLLGLSVAIGTVKAFQLPTQQAITPLLVPPEVLPRALAFSSAGMQGAVIAGPALGGFVYVAGAAAVYASCTALFALAAGLILRVHYHHAPRAPQAMTLDSLLAGVRFVRERPVVLGAISLDLFAVLLGGATALLPMFAKDILHVGPWGLGLLRGAPAAGALLMSLGLAHWPVQRGAGPVLLGAVAVYGASMLGFALSTALLLSIVMLAVSGAADMVSVVIRQSLVQLETPDEMRGRVSAVNSVFIGASNQLGEFESGATAALLGPVGSVLLGGFGSIAIAALWIRLFPALAHRDRLVEPR